MIDPSLPGRLALDATHATLQCSAVALSQTMSLMTQSFTMWTNALGAIAPTAATPDARPRAPAWYRAPEAPQQPLLPGFGLAGFGSTGASGQGRGDARGQTSPLDVVTEFWQGWIGALSGAASRPAAPAWPMPFFPAPAAPAAAWPMPFPFQSTPQSTPLPAAPGWPFSTSGWQMPSAWPMPPAFASWLSSAAMRLQPADAFRAMMSGGAHPAWPMAFSFIGLGMPREMAWPVAELGSTMTAGMAQAAQQSAHVLDQAFAAYRSPGGHATAQISRPVAPPRASTDAEAPFAWMMPPWMAMMKALSQPVRA